MTRGGGVDQWWMAHVERGKAQGRQDIVNYGRSNNAPRTEELSNCVSKILQFTESRHEFK